MIAMDEKSIAAYKARTYIIIVCKIEETIRSLTNSHPRISTQLREQRIVNTHFTGNLNQLNKYIAECSPNAYRQFSFYR